MVAKTRKSRNKGRNREKESMKTTKLTALLGLVLAMSVFASGCNLGCKKAFRYEGKVQSVQAVLSTGSASSDNVDTACASLKKEGFNILDKASNFAERAAYNRFYYEETKCVAGYWTTHCSGGYYGPRPYPRGGYYPPRSCYNQYVCTRSHTTTHKLDGFEDALFVSEQYKNAVTNLSVACAKAESGDKASAMNQFIATNTQLNGAVRVKATQALAKAGCYANKEEE